MKPRLKSSRAARELIKAHEAFLGQAVPRGRRWAVGYGHTAAAREGQTISREDAELLLLYDVMQAEAAIDAAVGAATSGPMRDALVSFACSIGSGAFKVSDVARLARDGRHLEAAAALETWVRAEEQGRLVVSERLVRRRAAEKALYLEGLKKDEPAPAPAPLETAQETAPQAETAPEAETPRLGPLVDLELEFVDPPEPAGMVDETPAEQAAETSAEVEAPAQQDAEPEAEAAPPAESTPVEAAPVKVAAETPAAPAEPSVDATRTVMARMAAQMSMTLAVEVTREDDVTGEIEPLDAVEQAEAAPAVALEPEPQPEAPVEPELMRVSADTRLGFSFLTPVRASALLHDELQPESAPVVSAPVQPEPVQPQPVDPAPVQAGPVPVYGSVTTVAASQAITPGAAVAHSLRAESPAHAAGYSGEVHSTVRPDDIDEDEEDTAEADEIHPGVLTGSAPEAAEPAPPMIAPREREKRSAGDGSLVFVANLVAGAALTGVGIWDILMQDANGVAAEFGWFGPVAAAMGVVLMIASGWMLISRRRKDDNAFDDVDAVDAD